MPKNSLNIILILFIFILTSCGSMPKVTPPPAKTAPTPFYAVEPISRASIEEDAFWQGNPNTTWDRLQHLPASKLASVGSTLDPIRASWIKLAIISKRYSHDSKQLIQQLVAWRTENPSHPGNSLFQANGTLSTLFTTSQPKHIALLLPLQGPMGSSGQAVRDGFLSAYYESLKSNNEQQTISFYDTSTKSNICELYNRAVNEGANIIVGPLIKEDVQGLITNNSNLINVPTLALNYTEGNLPNNLYEFGLSPIDEAQQIADKAWGKGASHAIIIAPQTAWGQRVSTNLVTRWKSLGGTVSDTFIFNKATDFNKAIASLLHVNTKEDRKKMQEDNNKIVLEQQRRQDFDVIFLIADPQAGRSVVPILKFYYAENIPIYATSSIYSGSPNPQRDKDLNGVNFADIPWLIKSAHNNNRLFAVGRDAFTISCELQRMTNLPNFPLYAATGALTLTANHQFYRRLPWTQIRNGHP